MKTKTSQYLKYCLICSRKTKKLDKKKLIDMFYKTAKSKITIDKFYDHYKIYICYFCSARYTITSCKDKCKNIKYSKKIFWVEVGELYYGGIKVCFEYKFNSKKLSFYKNSKYFFYEIFDFKDAIKYISKYLQNQIFQ